MLDRLKRSVGHCKIAELSAAVLLAAPTGCSALPTIVPDMARPQAQPVQLEGARGPLTASQSKAVIKQLQSRGKETSIFDRHLALEEAIVGSPLTVGNKVVLLQDGPTTYQHMFAAIRNAKDHINMETYIIEDDEVGNRFADVLIEKQAQGVQVNLIYDSVGAISTPQTFFQRLIDGQTTFLGGINISSVYSGGSFSRKSKQRPVGGPPWRDTHLQVEGPVVGEFQKMFLATWEKQKGEPLAPRNYFQKPANKGNEVVRAIGSSPDEPYSLIDATLLSAISNAETAVYLTNAYCLFRARSAIACGPQGRRAARRRCENHPAQ